MAGAGTDRDSQLSHARSLVPQGVIHAEIHSYPKPGLDGKNARI